MVDPVIPEGTNFEIAKDGIVGLVVGYDESPPSRDALAFAAGTARRNEAWIIVAFVSTIPAVAAMAPMTIPVMMNTEVDAPEVMAGLADLGVHATFQRATGDVATELERIAEESHADAIIVGRSASRVHAYAGSVTTRLIRHARRPICVVP
ncbi:MAG TPA: universal stress protein [Acidimicrobiales bacterium]|nr:universal stress protein [Acidimicrobiales bacterium]